MEKLSRLVRFIDKLSECTGKAFSYLILVVCILETVEVVLRYVFSSPTEWIWEFCSLLSAAIFVTGGAWVLKEGKHVRTDVIYARLSKRGQAIVDLVIYFTVFTSFIGVLVWKTIGNMAYSWRIHETTATMWGPPMYPVKTVIAISFILFALQGIAQVIRNITFLVKGEEL